MRKIKEQMLLLGLSPKKELINVLLVDLFLFLVAGVSYFLTKQIVYLASFVAMSLIFTMLYFSRYSFKINKKNTDNLLEFATLFGYFKIYIHNGISVYTALKELCHFANAEMKQFLKELINDIDNDKTVQPFVKFARRFNEIIIEEMMISIYQMIDDGESSEYLSQFELIFDKFSDLLTQKQLKTKDSRLGLLSSAPLIGACFLMIVLTIGIISIIGDFINGI